MILLFIFCFIIFLFCLYILGNDDLIMLRKNVSLEKVFNMAFLQGFLFLFFARIFYVVFHFRSGFLNPLVFFLFPYFPGLSMMGGVVGAVIFLLLFTAKKLPVRRLFDLFALSFLLSVTVGNIVLLPFSYQNKFMFLYSLIIIIFYSFIFKYTSYSFLRNKFSDSTAGAIVVFVISFSAFLKDIIGFWNSKYIHPELFLDVVLLLMSGFYLMKKEKIFKKLLMRRKKNG